MLNVFYVVFFIFCALVIGCGMLVFRMRTQVRVFKRVGGALGWEKVAPFEADSVLLSKIIIQKSPFSMLWRVANARNDQDAALAWAECMRRICDERIDRLTSAEQALAKRKELRSLLTWRPGGGGGVVR